MKTKKLLPLLLTFVLVLSVIFVCCDTSSVQDESSTLTEYISNTMTEKQPLETIDSGNESQSETEIETETHAPFDWVEKSYPDIELTENAYTLSCNYDLPTFFKAFEKGGDMFATYLEYWEKINPEHRWVDYETLCAWAQLSETLPLILPDDEIEVENYQIAYYPDYGYLAQYFRIKGVDCPILIKYHAHGEYEFSPKGDVYEEATFLGYQIGLKLSTKDDGSIFLHGNVEAAEFGNRNIGITVYNPTGAEITNESLDVLSHFRIAE